VWSEDCYELIVTPYDVNGGRVSGAQKVVISWIAMIVIIRYPKTL